MLRAYGSTDKGPLRPINEDCFGIDEHLGLCAWRTEWAATTPVKLPRAWRLMP